MSLGRPPSARPALDVAGGVATGRVTVGGGVYGPYQFVVKPLSAADWAALQATNCADFAQYPAGTVTYVRAARAAQMGGQVDITIHSGATGTGLSLDGDKANADPGVIALRALAITYFTVATF